MFKPDFAFWRNLRLIFWISYKISKKQAKILILKEFVVTTEMTNTKMIGTFGKERIIMRPLAPNPPCWFIKYKIKESAFAS